MSSNTTRILNTDCTGTNTTDEAQQPIAEQRQVLVEAETERATVPNSLENLRRNAEQHQEMRLALERVRDANLGQTRFPERKRAVELLDVNAYPCGDLTGVHLIYTVNREPLSHQRISIASPTLVLICMNDSVRLAKSTLERGSGLEEQEP